MEDLDTFYPTNKNEWRQWLKENHLTSTSIWLICYKKSSKKPSISWSEAVDEALCFGWIDSVRKSIDHERFIQFFSQRKPKSTWSKINKDKVIELEEKGLMFDAGRACIEIAKQNGSWTILDDVDLLIVPEDLGEAFKLHPNANANYYAFSKSTMKSILYWIKSAKRAETREKRIKEVAELANQNLKPKQFR
jgi:uncharacterized protein YdeI (YjbR/CyaY-like superfamily)